MQVTLTLICSIICVTLHAQPCRVNYSQSMEKGKQYLSANPPEYKKALTEFQAAQIAARECGFSSSEPSAQLKKVFEGLQRQREQAIDDRKLAEKQKLIAEAATAKAKLETGKALKAKEIAEAEKKKAAAALEMQRKADLARELATATSKEAEKAKRIAELRLDSIRNIYSEKNLLVIANNKGTPEKIDSTYMLSIFRGEVSRWPGGTKITTALITPETELGGKIAQSIFRIGKDKIMRHFRLLEYQGGQYTLFNSASQLEEFVSQTPGAIGILYLPPTSPNVRIVPVTGQNSAFK